ncbi:MULTISPECIES: N-acetylglucosamine-6-phosphate deacetylase [unclassified Luteococcus]|uniref:N-acetylglucosamine-6-phosphate deacetylase n=1 Tax=unclassified Luteococcus TaxID=2639923 RepID=UPI00313CA0BF
MPGLVDLQVNGYAGHDVNGEQGDASDIAAITALLATAGVTTWVPTIITGSREKILSCLKRVAKARQDPVVAAAVPYVHVEGPFISELDGPRGAHDLAQVRPVDADEVAEWNQVTRVGYVTLSPHWPGSAEQITRIVASGTRVAIGHTHCSPEEVAAAVDAGATMSTHLGNGIFAELPRHPNPIWSQLGDPRLTAGLIGDGHHLPGEVLEAMVRAKGTKDCFLVSDSAALAGSAPGVYDTPVGGRVELTADGRLTLPGTPLLAGSGVNLAQVVVSTLANTGLTVREVVEMASVTPSRLLGRTPAYLQAGARPDLVTLDESGRVLDVVQQGSLL